MKEYDGIIPQKCDGTKFWKCENSGNLIRELGVCYESAFESNEKAILCETCHYKFGLGKYNRKNVNFGRRIVLENDGKWYVPYVESEEDLEEKEKKVKEKFFSKFKKVIKIIPRAEDIVAMYYCALDKNTPVSVRASILGGLLYFIFPIDLIPDLIFGFGYSDDFALLTLILKIIWDNINDKHRLSAEHFLDDKVTLGCDCFFCSN